MHGSAVLVILQELDGELDVLGVRSGNQGLEATLVKEFCFESKVLPTSPKVQNLFCPFVWLLEVRSRVCEALS